MTKSRLRCSSASDYKCRTLTLPCIISTKPLGPVRLAQSSICKFSGQNKPAIT